MSRRRREIHFLLGAVKVAERLGTWILYELADTEDIRYLIGYVEHRIRDFERRKKRTQSIDRRVFYSRRIGHWRRALRWLGQIDPEHAGAIGDQVVAAIKKSDEWSQIPYVSQDEIDPTPARPDQKLRDKPPRRRRPSVKRVPPKSQICGRCDGIGYTVS